MKKIKILLYLLLTLVICSCGGNEPEPSKPEIFDIILNVDSALDGIVNIDKTHSIEEGNTFTFPVINSDVYYDEEYRFNDDVAKYTRTVTNFEFVSWVDPYGNDNIDEAVIFEDIEFELKYNLSTKTSVVNFNLNGGSFVPSKNTDINVFTLPIPEKLNYTFGGWYYNKSLRGSAISKINYSNINGSIDLYAKFTPSTSYVQSLIDSIPEEISILDIENIENAYQLYQMMSEEAQVGIVGYDNLKEIYNNLDPYREAYEIYLKLENIYNVTPHADLKNPIEEVKSILENTSEEVKNLIVNLDIEKLEEISAKVDELYELYKADAVAFDKKIAKLPLFLEQYYVEEIEQLYAEYLELNDNIKVILKAYPKLETMYNTVQELDNKKVVYYASTSKTNNVYKDKAQLFEAFFSDFYYYIVSYHGTEHLENNGLFNVKDFVTLACDFNGAGANNLYGIGNIAGRYMLEKDINGILDNQTENGFFGFCYHNDLYQDLLPFFINFFAYWRIDERYANTSNYGADIFAEAWAPTVDIAKFFYYDENTSYVKTERMIDCLTNIASVAYGLGESSSTLPTLRLRGYVFKGWYDNPEFSGSPVTSINQLKGNKVYAKWEIDQNQVNLDSANLVDVYIYNLTTSKAVVNETTVNYVVEMYNNLTEDAKALVKEYETLIEIKNKL